MRLTKGAAWLTLALLTLAPQAAWAVCGDRVREMSETCDDGNTMAGDGCSATCQVEAGFVCESGDFTLQVAESLPGGTQPNWTLAADRRSVTQSTNSVAGVYTTNMPADIAEIVFTLRVGESGGDDDFIGWSIGFEVGELSTAGMAGDRDFLYFNWKQGTQNNRTLGLRLSRVTGPVTDTNMWESNGNSAFVATATNLGNTGWDDNRAYQVRMRYSPNRILVWVNPSTDLSVNGVFNAANERLEFDTSGSFPAGNFGFYTQSQPQGQFRLVRVGNGGLGADVCSVDSDRDGVKDRSDLESDGDGIPDLSEMPGFVNDPDVDTDLDGVADWSDPNHVPGGCTGTGNPARCVTLPIALDRDQDGLPNHLDLDSDGDGLPDAYEAGLVDLNLNGLPDACMSVDGFGRCVMGGLVGAAPNADMDLLANFLDTDSDNDGLLDSLEGFDANGDQVADRVASGFDTFRNGLDDAFDPRCTGNLCGGRVGVVSTRPDADMNGVHNYLQVCGDAYKIMAEGCDDGNAAAGDGCSAVCQIESGYVCMGTPRSVCTSVCGNGVVAGMEACDDNNVMSGDGCSAMCQVEAGYTCPTAGGVCLTVDLVAPGALAVVITANTTYSGTATAGAVVTVTVRDAANAVVDTFTVTAAANGTWSATRPRADGSYSVTASVTTTGGTYTDAANSFRVDATAPAVALTAPVNNTFTNDTTPTISGTATDAGGLAVAGPVTVTVTNAQGMVVFTGTPVVNGMGVWTVDTSALPAGAYTVTATARDAAGNTTATPARTFTVDNANPTIAITAPVNNTRTNDTTPTLSGTAADGIGLAAANPVTVTVRDAAMMVVFTSSPAVNGAGVWSVDTSALAQGTYTVSAAVTDRAGNTASAGPVTFTIDTTPPAVAITAPANNSRVNDATPALSGTAEVGATVTVTVRDALGAVVFTGTPVVNAQGQWTIDASALADGDYAVSVSARDAAGNTANAGPNAFILDATAPSVVITLPANGSATNDSTPTVEGTTEPFASVTLEILNAQGMVVFTANPAVIAGGVFFATSTMLADGVYSARATVTDLAGNSATSAATSFRVDTQAPVTTITAPADGAVTSNVRPSLSGTSEPGAQVELELRNAQGVVIFTQTVTADAMTGAWSAALGADLVSASYTLTAEATDAAGNAGQPVSSSFVIDTTVFPLEVLTPVDGAAVSNAQPAISGTTAANTAVTVELRDAAGALIETLMTTANAAGVWSVTPTMALVDGAYVVTATVRTAAGVASNDSAGFTVDTLAPMVTLDTPADGAALNVAQPVISGTSEPGAEIEVTLLDAQGAVIETLTATADMLGAWSVTPAMALVDGAYAVSATASDRAGNATTAGPNDFTVDTLAPALSLLTPVDGAVSGVRDVVVSGVTEAGQEVVIELRDGMGNVLSTQTVTADGMGVYSATFQNLANGGYSAEVSVSDAAGNVSEEEASFSVDSEQPTLTVNTPADGALSNTGALVVSGTADADATVTVVVRDAGGNIVFNAPATVNMDGTFSLTLTPALMDGAYVVEVTATRPNGLSTSEERDVVVDQTAPVTMISQPGAGAVVGSATPTITGTSEPNSVVTITIDGMVVGTATADANGMWSFAVTTPLAEGAHSISASATDAAGNAGQPATVEFTIDLSAPMVTITAPMAGSQVGSPVVVTGTAEPGAVVTILIDGMAAGMATADASGAWSFEAGELSNGMHTVEATSTDAGGNAGSSGVVSFEVKTSAPVAILTPVNGGQVTGPSVTVTGTGEPGSTITVTAGGQTKTVVVGEDGSWSVTFDDLPAGSATIEATDGTSTSTVTFTVNDPTTDADSYILAGGCAQSAGSAGGAGGSALWLLGLGLVALRRRRRA